MPEEESKVNTPGSKGNIVLLLFGLGLLAFFGVYGWAAWSMAKCSGERLSHFGDAFAVPNALISGLGLLGVVYAILQQHHSLRLQAKQTQMQAAELKLQRQELADTREELARSTEAQNKTSKALTNELKVNRIRVELEIILISLDREHSHINSSHRDQIGALNIESFEDGAIDVLIQRNEHLISSGVQDAVRSCLVRNLKIVKDLRRKISELHCELRQVDT